MAIGMVQAGRTAWLVNWPLIRSIVRSYFRHKAMLELGKINRTPAFETSIVVDIFSFGQLDAPMVSTYDVDFTQVRGAVERQSSPLLEQYKRALFDQNNPAYVQAHLFGLAAAAEAYKRKYRQLMRDATDDTMRSIDRAVRQGEMAASVATHVRDGSAGFIMLGAGFMSGGAAWAAAGGGSLMKGGFKYQDRYIETGDHGKAMTSATLEATTEFIMFAIPADEIAKMSGANRIAGEATVVFIGASFETSKAIVDGKTVNDAMIAGGASIAADLSLMGVDAIAKERVQTFFKRPGVKSFMEKTPIPVAITPPRHLAPPESISRYGDAADNLLRTATRVPAGRIKSASVSALTSQPEASERERTAAAEGAADRGVVESALRPLSQQEYETLSRRGLARSVPVR